MTTNPPLVYVYTGNPLPRYAIHNLAITKKRYDGELIVLTDREATSRHAQIIDIREWYDPEPFRQFCERSPLDQHFRGGFWVRAAERFFVLEQYMRHRNLERIFHVEMDVLALSLDGYGDTLDQFGKAVFAPLEAQKQAVASLMYVNSREAIAELCAYAIKNAQIGNEMKILGHFFFENPNLGIGLPSNHVFSQDKWPMGHQVVPTETGVVDASFLGMWVLGQDPKNSENSVWNHYHPGLTTHDVNKLRFGYSLASQEITVREKGLAPHLVRNMHVYSKVFGRLRFPLTLPTLVLASNLPFRLPVVVRTSNLWASFASPLLRRRPGALIEKMPRPLRRLATSFVRWSFDQSDLTLSNRELSVLFNWQDPNPLTAGEAPDKIVRRPVTSLTGEPKNRPHRKRDPQSQQLSERARAERDLAREVFHSTVEGVLVVADDSLMESNLIVKNHAGRQIVFLDPTKRFPENRLAEDFWGPKKVSKAWAFSDRIQMFLPALVREMFGDSEAEIDRWASMEGHEGPRELSFSQSYGAWVTKNYPERVTFAKPPMASKRP